MLSLLYYGRSKLCYRQLLYCHTDSHQAFLQVPCGILPNNVIQSWSKLPVEQANSVALPDSRGANWHQLADSCYRKGVARLFEGGHIDEAVAAADLQRGPPLPTNLLYCLLQGCIRRKNITLSRQVHALIVRSGLQENVFLGSHLIRMYSALGSLSEAQQVFSRLLAPDSFAWAAIISGYSKHGQPEQAIKLYHQMQECAVKPNGYLFVAVLKACACAGSIAAGKLIHSHVIESGMEFSAQVGNSLLHMYAKCGSLGDALYVFNKLPTKDLVTWTSLIAGYTIHGCGDEALQLFWQMKQEGIHPDKVTVLGILKACSSKLALEQAKLIHAFIKELGLEFDLFVASSLVDLYVKCGSVEEAYAMFNRLPQRDHVTWTAMISGHVHEGNCHQALLLYEQMLQERMEPDRITCISILQACSVLEALERGRLIHAHILSTGGESDMYLANTLIHMYAKSGSMDEARRLFERLRTRDLVSLNALIAGYAANGDARVAVDLFWEMQQEGMQPDSVTLVNVLKACGCVGAVHLGKAVHTYTLDQGFGENPLTGSSLIDMYAKCGSLEDARGVFDRLHAKDAVCYSAIIAAYAQHGYAQMALEVFHKMQEDAIPPTSIIFLCLLSACSNCGLLEEGLHTIELMTDFGIAPNMEHYVCIVDLLGRTGHLLKAAALIRNMRLLLDIRVWRSLLGSCRIHGNVALGKYAYDALLSLDSSQTSAYLLMADIYSDAGRFLEEKEVLCDMHSTGFKKEPGRTWMELNNQFHSFVVHDNEHWDKRLIYYQLDDLKAYLS